MPRERASHSPLSPSLSAVGTTRRPEQNKRLRSGSPPPCTLLLSPIFGPLCRSDKESTTSALMYILRRNRDEPGRNARTNGSSYSGSTYSADWGARLFYEIKPLSRHRVGHMAPSRATVSKLRARSRPALDRRYAIDSNRSVERNKR